MRWSRQLGVVLAAFLSDPAQWRHGYALSKETGIGSGTLYPLLARLEECGWIRARWEESAPGRPPRRAYKLTAAGRSQSQTFLASRLQTVIA